MIIHGENGKLRWGRLILAAIGAVSILSVRFLLPEEWKQPAIVVLSVSAVIGILSVIVLFVAGTITSSKAEKTADGEDSGRN